MEPLLFQEVRDLRLPRAEQQVGGVYFEASPHDAWRANLELRTAIRVLRRLARFTAPHADALYAGVQEIDWSSWIGLDATFAIEAQTRDSQLDHSMFVGQRTKDAIVDQLRERHGRRPTVDRDDPDLRLHVHLSRDRATISVDTSGPSLHKRGWRVAQGTAPLAETLAAAILLHSEWDRRAPLIDPFCGSGTILIEAALLASGTAPGLSRPEFAFERFPGHDETAWTRLRDEAWERVRPLGKLRLLGYESDPRIADMARANVEAAGFAESIEIVTGDGLGAEWKSGWGAWVVTNPPYGERVGESAAIDELYRRLAAKTVEAGDSYRFALLCGNPALGAALPEGRFRSLPLQNGGIACDLHLA